MLQTPWPETGDYKAGRALCQAQVGQDLQDSFKIYMIILKNLVSPVYVNLVIRYHTPYPTTPITPRITTANNVINNLNFR